MEVNDWDIKHCAPSGSKAMFYKADPRIVLFYDDDANHTIGAGWGWVVLDSEYDGDIDSFIVSLPNNATKETGYENAEAAFNGLVSAIGNAIK